MLKYIDTKPYDNIINNVIEKFKQEVGHPEFEITYRLFYSDYVIGINESEQELALEIVYKTADEMVLADVTGFNPNSIDLMVNDLVNGYCNFVADSNNVQLKIDAVNEILETLGEHYVLIRSSDDAYIYTFDKDTYIAKGYFIYEDNTVGKEQHFIYQFPTELTVEECVNYLKLFILIYRGRYFKIENLTMVSKTKFINEDERSMLLNLPLPGNDDTWLYIPNVDEAGNCINSTGHFYNTSSFDDLQYRITER